MLREKIILFIENLEHSSTLHMHTLFDTGASINVISLKFYSAIQQQANLLPTNRKVVSADGNSLGPIVEAHLKFKLGKIEFNDVFVILNSLQ